MNAGGITVIIVSRGLRALLAQSLSNLLAALRVPALNNRPYRIVVADNASAPPYSPEEFQRNGIELIRFDRHTPFAKANNAAASCFPNDYYLLQNNDVLLAADTVSEMLRVLEQNRNAGICGSRLLFADGTIQHAGVVFGAGDKGPYHLHRGRPPEQVSRMNREFQAVTGACMMVRKQVWDRLNGLDEAYPFGLEDIDFCLRARQLGWRVFCCNTTESIHFESMTPGRVELDVGSRALFMTRWKDRYAVDG